MRAYKKSTRHPYCLYLRSDELIELLAEASGAVHAAWRQGQQLPALAKVHDRLALLLKEKP
ncbi:MULTISPECIES: hypothetical protein [Streptomyces]|uniref:Uncharacterized protein n=2 Tax=Streptomyces TaxID=1883 RepID=A0ABV9IVC0_9ACTN